MAKKFSTCYTATKLVWGIAESQAAITRQRSMPCSLAPTVSYTLGGTPARATRIFKLLIGR